MDQATKNGYDGPEPENAGGDETPRRFRKFLRGTFHHYSAIMPGKFSWWVRLLLRFLFRAYTLADSDVEAIREAAKKGPILYVGRDRSRLEYLAFMEVLGRYGLPVPRFAHYVSMYPFQPAVQTLRRLVSVIAHYAQFRTYPNPYRNGFLAKLLASRTPSLLFVSDFRAMPRRFGSRETDILTEIFRAQRGLHLPIQVVPVAVVHGHKPDREVATLPDLVFGPTAHPGGLRRISMSVRYRKNVTLRVGEIDSLENMTARLMPRNMPTADRSPELAYLVRRSLIERLDEERRVVLGPIRKSRDEMIEATLHGQGLVEYLRAYAKDNGASFVDARARARRYLNEMAADYSPATIAFADVVLRWVLRKGKGRIEVDAGGLESAGKAARRMPVVYVPCHKSHFDYLLVSYVLYQNNVSLPYVLSGINLNRWPIGGFFRRSGAFFLRRAFKGKRVYSRTVAAYVETLLREGNNLEFFVEGGRSRIGKLLPPKAGFISILLDAFRASGQSDIAFVPVMIDYERIFEEKFYSDEAADKKAAGNKLLMAMENRKLIQRRIGDIHIAFCEPMTLGGFLRDLGASEVPGERSAQMDLARKIAFKVTWGIIGKSLVRPYAVAATVLLANPHRALLMDDLVRNTRLLLEYFESRGIQVVGDLLGRDPDWPERVAELAAREKWIRIEAAEDAEEETVVSIEKDVRLPLTIHRNTILHFYQEIALFSLAVRAAGGPASRESLLDAFLFAKNLLSSEMIYGPEPIQAQGEERRMFDSAWDYFSSKGYLVPSDQGFVPSVRGAQAVALFSSALTALVETYYIAAWTLLKHHGKEMSDREWIRKAMKRGAFLLEMGEILYPEAVHKTHCETAFRQFASMGYCTMAETVGEKSRVLRTIKAPEAAPLEGLLGRLKDYLRRT